MSKKLSRADIVAAMKNPTKRSRKKEPAADSKYTAEQKAQMDAEGKGLSGAAKAWQEKFVAMNDSEFWLCICFHTPEDLERFTTESGITASLRELVPASRVIADLDLGEAMAGEEPAHRKMTRFRVDREEIKANLAYQSHPDPLDGFVDTDDPVGDQARELEILAAALRAGQDPTWLATHGKSDDHPNWFTIAFPDRAAKNKFLRITGLDAIGDKYLDGRKCAVVLKLPMGATKAATK